MKMHITQAAEGLPRRAFTTADSESMMTSIHKDPTHTGYRTVYDRERGIELYPHLVDGFSISFDTI